MSWLTFEFSNVDKLVKPVPPSATAKAVPSVKAPDISAFPFISSDVASNSPLSTVLSNSLIKPPWSFLHFPSINLKKIEYFNLNKVFYFLNNIKWTL